MLSTGDKAKVQKQLSRILKDNDKLESALYILEKSLAFYRLDVSRYLDELSGLLRGVYGGAQVDAEIQAALKKFYANLRGVLSQEFIAQREAERAALKQAVLNNYGATVGIVINAVGERLNSRAAQFKLSAELLKVPVRIADDIAARELQTITVGGQIYYKQPLENLWFEMIRNYGRYDTVEYRNGAQYPMRSYVDGRINTTEAETARFVVEAEAASVGILFLTIPANGTTDSCIYHERQTLIASEAAREIALRRWPEYAAQISTMLTPGQVKADGTHMFQHNCKHGLVPDQIQFKSAEKQKTAFEGFKPADVPDKINERQIFEDVTGTKYEQAAPSKKPAPKLR